MSKSTRKVPYIITPGNHEMYSNGDLFNYRFRMPNTNEDPIKKNHMYDMVFKGTYFMFMDFDYLYIYRDKKPDEDLFRWMKERIEILNKRTDIIWKVFVSHRPFSCSDWTAPDCFVNMYYLRKYEDFLLKNGFQFMLQGHLHSYTRSKPLNGLTILPQNKIGSGAMVSIVDGHSGTAHYFMKPGEEDRVKSSIMQSVDGSGPSYVRVEVSPDRFQTILVRADTGELKDTFSIDRTSLDDAFGRRKRFVWVKYTILIVIASVLLGLVMISYLYQKKLEVGLINDKLQGEAMQNPYKKVVTNEDKTQVKINITEDELSKQSTASSPNTKSASNPVSPINIAI